MEQEILKYNFNKEEYRVFQLSKKFDRYFSKHYKKPTHSLPFKRKNPKESKNWKYFEEALKFLKQTPTINEDIFIESQVKWAKENKKICRPNWLTTPNTLRRYFDFVDGVNKRPNTQETSYTEEFEQSLKNSIMFIFKQMKENKIPNILQLLSYTTEGALVPQSFIWVLNGSISHSFLSVSRSYSDFFKHLDPDIKREYPSLESLREIREKIILNNKLNTFCKKVIPEEINF